MLLAEERRVFLHVRLLKLESQKRAAGKFKVFRKLAKDLLGWGHKRGLVVMDVSMLWRMNWSRTRRDWLRSLICRMYLKCHDNVSL